MKIANQFTVSAPIEQAWDVLCDLEQVIPLMPGAQLIGHEGDDYLGKVKVKVGPVTSEFSGKVRFVEQDRDQHRAVIDGKGKEARGTGNAAATVTAQLHEDGGAHPRHRRHRSEDRRQAGPVRQRNAAAGVGEVAGPVRGFAGSRTGGLRSPESPASAVDGEEQIPAWPINPVPGPRVVLPLPSPSPSICCELAGGDRLKKYGAGALAVLAVLVLIWVLRRRR